MCGWLNRVENGTQSEHDLQLRIACHNYKLCTRVHVNMIFRFPLIWTISSPTRATTKWQLMPNKSGTQVRSPPTLMGAMDFTSASRGNASHGPKPTEPPANDLGPFRGEGGLLELLNLASAVSLAKETTRALPRATGPNFVQAKWSCEGCLESHMLISPPVNRQVVAFWFQKPQDGVLQLH